MGALNSIGNFIGKDKVAKFAAGTAGTVYVMTGIKAVGRPYFIYTDKNTDKATKKYAATSEFLYQLICLGVTLAMIPFFKTGGLKLAEKYLKQNPESAKILENVSKTNIYSRSKAFDNEFSKVKEGFKEVVNGNKKGKLPTTDFEKAMAKGHGAIEAGSFIGSIIGLTLLAPPLSHKIVHPIMKALGMSKEEKPAEIKSLNKTV